MAWYDYLNPMTYLDAGASAIGKGLHWLTDKGNPGKDVDLPYFQEDRDRLQGMLDGHSPYVNGAATSQGGQVGQDPWQSGWASLIQQLQDQAAGRGPSLAVQQYQRASGDAMAQQTALARGGRTAGGARQAAQNLGAVQQGMASGSAMARTQEQMGAIGQLGGALSGAGNAQYQRDALQAQLAQQNNQFNASAQNQVNAQNQAAYLNILAQQLGLSASQLQALIARASINANAKSPLDTLLGMGSQLGGLAHLGGGGGQG